MSNYEENSSTVFITGAASGDLDLLTVKAKEIMIGKRILITRSYEQSVSFFSKLLELGADPINCPIVNYSIAEKEIYNKNIVNNISHFDWIFFTSQNAVKYFFEILGKNCYDSRALAKTQIAVVGYKTKTELAKYNINPDFIPKRFSFNDLVQELNEKKGLQAKKILLPSQCGIIHTVPGIDILTWGIYKSIFIENLDEAMLSFIKKGIHIITLFSSNTATHFSKLVKKYDLEESIKGALIATIGDETAKTVKELFGRVDIIAEPYTEDGLISSIEKFIIKEKNKINA